MIIHDKFIWLHIAKMGGTFTRHLFDIVLEDYSFNDNKPHYHSDLEYKHDHLSSRKGKNPGFDVQDRDCIINIRRLPNYIRSFNIHIVDVFKEHMGNFLTKNSSLSKQELRREIQIYKKEPLFVQSYLKDMDLFSSGFVWTFNPSFFMVNKVMMQSKQGSLYALCADDILRAYMNGCNTIHWLRLEHIKDDFIACFDEKFNMLTDDKKSQIIEATALNKTKNRQKFPINLNKDQLSRLYKNNPLWTELERQLYGSALIDDV